MDLYTLTSLVTLLLYLAPSEGIILNKERLMRCPPRSLNGGRVRLRSKGRVAKYVCLRGYQVLGDKYSTCVRGKWDTPIPICINRGCLSLDVPHGQVLELYRGALVTIDCDPGYSLIGSKSLYCNGARWNGTAPTCKEMKVSTQKFCDFEEEDLCGWSHDNNHDFDWKRHNFATPSGHVGTGPSYDHSLGPALNGHYMYLETSSPRLQNDTARLFSPVFAAPDGPACFSFWYHMYGLTTGLLNVYQHSKDSTLLFSLSGNQGDNWRQAIIPLPHLNSSFQIVIEGVRGAGYEGDTAVDDVRLAEGDECISFTTESVEESSCVGRCSRRATEPSWCECTADCVSNNTCCMDFPQECAAAVQVTTTSIVVALNNTVPTTTVTMIHESSSSHRSSSPLSIVTATTRVTTLPAHSTTVPPPTTTTTYPQHPTVTSISSTVQSPSISPTESKTATVQLSPKLSTSKPTLGSTLLTTKTANTSPKHLLISVNPLNTTGWTSSTPSFGNKSDSRRYFQKLTTSPVSVSSLLSTTTTNTSPKPLSTSVNPLTKAQLTTSPTHTDTLPYFTHPSTSEQRSTSKQFATSTKARVYKVTETTTAKIVPIVSSIPTKAYHDLKTIRFYLSRSTKKDFYLPTKSLPAQATTLKQVMSSLRWPSTLKPSTSLGTSSSGIDPRLPTSAVRTTPAVKPWQWYPKRYTSTTFALSPTTLSPKTMRNSSGLVPKSKNDVLHPASKDGLPVHPPLPPLDPKPEDVVPSSETVPSRPTETTVSMTSSLEGWRWKSKYRQRVDAPVHAPVQGVPNSATDSRHMMRNIVLTCCGLLVITAVLVTVCVVRRRKINRGNDEDDELDIRFIPPDEILDFTLARPSLEETRLCDNKL